MRARSFSCRRERRLSEQPGPYCAVSCLGARCASVFRFSARQNCLAVTQEASLTGWTVVGFVPYENILSDFLETRTQVLLIALACGMFILLCILLSTSLVTRNLNRLSQAVAKIDQEHLSLEVEIQSLDEVGQLYRQIQFMLRSIRELIADIRRTESEKRDSEIRALQAQINPHFCITHSIPFNSWPLCKVRKTSKLFPWRFPACCMSILTVKNLSL